MNARKQFIACFAFALLAIGVAFPGAVQAFGITSLSTISRDEHHSVDLQAGTHPYEYEVDITMNQDGGGKPEGTLRDLVVELPPGLVGNPQAVRRCTGASFEGSLPKCPGNTQVGVARILLPGNEAISPVFNLTPPQGAPASLGFSVIGENSFQEASVRSGGDYGVNISDITIPTDLEIKEIKETIWGVPASSAHDPERVCFVSEPVEEFQHGCSARIEPTPFLSLPTSCAGPLKTTVAVRSLQNPDVVVRESAESRGEGGIPEGLSGCEVPPFHPKLTAQPGTATADSPAGLNVDVKIRQNQNVGPNAATAAHLKNAVIALPQGLVVNPSAAGGRDACSSAQIGFLGFEEGRPQFSPGPAECPASSKVGTVEVNTPLVGHLLPGAVYLAKQGDNPFNSLLALYVTVDDPLTGVVAKLPGKVVPDSVTGQLTATFENNPQLPFEDLTTEFFGGPRATLTTPSTCGTYTTAGTMTPWTSPQGADVKESDSFSIATAPGGGPCAATEAQLPNAPSFEAGTTVPTAGRFAPFVLKLSRENGSQHFGAFNTTLPQGLTAKIAGVQECSDAQIAHAQARREPGEGALELASPSCPQASQVGVVNVGAGSGNPLFVQGKIYLAGPYKGAPLSVAIVTPAVAGPFDLGVVVVRSALFVDPSTGQATVKSDQIPTILQGIPLDVRTIAVKIDRSDFSLNPTSCEAKTISGEEISTTGAVAPLQNRFQAVGCKALDYSPKLALSMKGGTRRSAHPALKGVLTQPSGQANSRRISVVLPATEFIDQNHIANPCTRPQFSEGKCPPASVLGKAKVFTPLLDQPLEGPIYFRANGGERELPDIVVDLHGKVHVVLVGFTDSVHKKGTESSRVRTIFAAAPDDPVSKAIVELNGGKKGLLVNSANICKVANVATVKTTAQNNKTQDFNQRIHTSCPK